MACADLGCGDCIHHVVCSYEKKIGEFDFEKFQEKLRKHKIYLPHWMEIKCRFRLNRWQVTIIGDE